MSGEGAPDSGSGRSGPDVMVASRLLEQWGRAEWTQDGDCVVVGCSGGLDSLVLLHLLRFSLPDLGLTVEAAHFDHGMRSGSEEDALWLAGVCDAWSVPCRRGTAVAAPADEAEARALRYEFFESLLEEGGRRWVLTAHHADDQVETVLFRVLRGTGVTGLRGIPRVRPPGVLRPLLSFRRGELEAYARRHRLRPRVDPTNRSPRHARNRVRRELLPLLEEIHAGARASILRLARNSDRVDRMIELLLAAPMDALVLETTPQRLVLDRTVILKWEEPVRGELLRRAAEGRGVVLSESGTASAMQFISEGQSGGGVDLGDGLRLLREFDRLVLTRPSGEQRLVAPRSEGSGLRIDSPDPGDGEVKVGSRTWFAGWGRGSQEAPGERALFDVTSLDFPLTLRAWAPGDRTRTEAGSKKLKKLFGELRVPVAERRQLPILVDAAGWVVWIPGLHQAPGTAPPSNGEGEGEPWFLGVRDGGRS